MTDLRLVAVTPERTHLVLEDDKSNQFRVPIDERLANALRAHRSGTAPKKSGQLEIALESQLTPREIQSRIRAGRGIDEVAVAAGISTERVERYAAPVLAEREHVADQAKLAPARRASGGNAPRLGDLVEMRLTHQNVAQDSVHWDAWRGEDDRWTVHLAYLAGTRERTAQWTYDPRGRVLAPANDEARWLVDETAPERSEDGTPTPVRRLSSVPTVEGNAADGPDPVGAPLTDPADQVYDHEADQARTEPERQVARAGRRPAVPSWDDIMFGARKRD
ncbi:MAG: septation protein SepH [Actinomycetes bacterium]